MEVYLYTLAAIVFIVGIYSIIATLLNLRHFRKMSDVESKTEGPLISIVIPARNEEHNLPRLLESLVRQTYKNIEILIINDQSSDRTSEIISSYERKDSRIHGFNADPSKRLNSNGKINALLQVLPHVKGEYIVATDADTEHSPDCVAHSLSVMRKNNLDIISGFPSEICPSYFGLVHISAMMLTNIFIPHFLVYHFPIPSAAFAIGQFIMMRTDAYNETGGYSAITNTICDDIGIVRLFVRKKKKYAFISMSRYVSCHMYKSSREAFRGIERSIAGVLPPRIAFIPILLVVVVIVINLSLSPLLSLIFFIALGPSMELLFLVIGWLSLWIAWYVGCRAANWKKRISTACFAMLFDVAIMYLHGLYKEISGKGFEWKGRNVR